MKPLINPEGIKARSPHYMGVEKAAASSMYPSLRSSRKDTRRKTSSCFTTHKVAAIDQPLPETNLSSHATLAYLLLIKGDALYEQRTLLYHQEKFVERFVPLDDS